MDLTESKARWQKRIENLRKRILKREVAVFSFFLVLSFIFWFLNALSKDMSVRVDYPVRYINLPEDRALVNELPDYLSLMVNGPGYSVIQSKLDGRKEHLTVDLDKAGIRVRENGDKLKFYILSYSLREQLSSQIKSDFSVSTIVPDTINFEFDLIGRRRVPVIPDIEISTQRQFLVHGDIVCDPDSIEISGPSTMIDTIDAVYTKHHIFDQLKETQSKTLGLKPISKVGFSERRSDITVPVEQFTELILEIPITMINVPDTLNIRLFPDLTRLQCIVALSDYNNINDAPIEAVVDFKNLDIRSTNRLKILLENLPDYASQVRINPQYVEYLIERK